MSLTDVVVLAFLSLYAGYQVGKLIATIKAVRESDKPSKGLGHRTTTSQGVK